MSTSLSCGGSLEETPFSRSEDVSPDSDTLSERLTMDVPDSPLQTGKVSASVSIKRTKS